MKKREIMMLATSVIMGLSMGASMAIGKEEVICEARKVEGGLVTLDCGKRGGQIEIGKKYKVKVHIEGC